MKRGVLVIQVIHEQNGKRMIKSREKDNLGFYLQLRSEGINIEKSESTVIHKVAT